MKLSVIVVTYNSAEVIGACLRSVQAQLPGAETIVVDNASRDGAVEIARAAGATVHANETNAGFGRACNQGAEAASGTHLLFLNPDVELDSVDGDALAAEFERSPFGLLAPVLQSGARARRAQRPWRVELLSHVLAPLRPRELPVLPRPVIRRGHWWPAGALVFVEREEFRRLGGFDPRFFLYYEDMDLARRYRSAGLPIRLTHSLRGHHHPGSSSTGEGSGAAVRAAWSYLGWLEYLCTWQGPDTAARAARQERRLRGHVDRALGVAERVSPAASRARRKRVELAEVEHFLRWQSTFGEGTAAADFCPRARAIVGTL